MSAIPHLGFIVAAYGVTVLVLGGTVLAIVLDGRTQKRALARLERANIRPATCRAGYRRRRMSATDAVPAEAKPRRARRLLVTLPLIAFFGLAALFLVRLGAGDPSRIPSALIGRPVPAFALQAVPGHPRPRARRRGSAGRPRHPGQRVRVLVRRMPRRARAAHGLGPGPRADRAGGRARRHRRTRTMRRTRGAISARRAIPTPGSATTRPAAPPSISASTACRRPS